VHQVATATGTDDDSAHVHARSVLSVLGGTITGGELNKLISQLPAGYTELSATPS
jgi:uncharacterized protein (DUF2267 family)